MPYQKKATTTSATKTKTEDTKVEKDTVSMVDQWTGKWTEEKDYSKIGVILWTRKVKNI